MSLTTALILADSATELEKRSVADELRDEHGRWSSGAAGNAAVTARTAPEHIAAAAYHADMYKHVRGDMSKLGVKHLPTRIQFYGNAMAHRTASFAHTRAAQEMTSGGVTERQQIATGKFARETSVTANQGRIHPAMKTILVIAGAAATIATVRTLFNLYNIAEAAEGAENGGGGFNGSDYAPPPRGEGPRPSGPPRTPNGEGIHRLSRNALYSLRRQAKEDSSEGRVAAEMLKEYERRWGADDIGKRRKIRKMSSLTSMILADAEEVTKGGPGSGPRPGQADRVADNLILQHTRAAQLHRTAASAEADKKQASYHLLAANAHDKAVRAIVRSPFSGSAVNRSLDARAATDAAIRGEKPYTSHYLRYTAQGVALGVAQQAVIGGILGGAAGGVLGGPAGIAEGALLGARASARGSGFQAAAGGAGGIARAAIEQYQHRTAERTREASVSKGGPGSGPRPGHAAAGRAAENASTIEGHEAASAYHLGEAQRAKQEMKLFGSLELKNKVPARLDMKAHQNASKAHLKAASQLRRYDPNELSQKRSSHAQVMSYFANRGMTGKQLEYMISGSHPIGTL